LDVRELNYHEDGEPCNMCICVVCNIHIALFGSLYPDRCYGKNIYYMRSKQDMHIQFWLENLTERAQLRYQVVDDRILLKWRRLQRPVVGNERRLHERLM
jgi:hypothetical protein